MASFYDRPTVWSSHFKILCGAAYNNSMKQVVFEVVDSPEGGYEATALGHRIYTQGETWENLKAMVQDAVRCHFEQKDRPALIRLLFVREEALSA